MLGGVAYHTGLHHFGCVGRKDLVWFGGISCVFLFRDCLGPRFRGVGWFGLLISDLSGWSVRAVDGAAIDVR